MQTKLVERSITSALNGSHQIQIKSSRHWCSRNPLKFAGVPKLVNRSLIRLFRELEPRSSNSSLKKPELYF